MKYFLNQYKKAFMMGVVGMLDGENSEIINGNNEIKNNEIDTSFPKEALLESIRVNLEMEEEGTLKERLKKALTGISKIDSQEVSTLELQKYGLIFQDGFLVEYPIVEEFNKQKEEVKVTTKKRKESFKITIQQEFDKQLNNFDISKLTPEEQKFYNEKIKGVYWPVLKEIVSIVMPKLEQINFTQEEKIKIDNYFQNGDFDEIYKFITSKINEENFSEEEIVRLEELGKKLEENPNDLDKIGNIFRKLEENRNNGENIDENEASKIWRQNSERLERELNLKNHSDNINFSTNSNSQNPETGEPHTVMEEGKILYNKIARHFEKGGDLWYAETKNSHLLRAIGTLVAFWMAFKYTKKKVGILGGIVAGLVASGFGATLGAKIGDTLDDPEVYKRIKESRKKSNSHNIDSNEHTTTINEHNPIYRFIDTLKIPEDLKKETLKKVSLDLYGNNLISNLKIKELKALQNTSPSWSGLEDIFSTTSFGKNPNLIDGKKYFKQNEKYIKFLLGEAIKKADKLGLSGDKTFGQVMLEEVDNSTTGEQVGALDNSGNQNNVEALGEVKEKEGNLQLRIYIEDGRQYIIGEDGAPKLFSETFFSEEFKEKLKNYKKTLGKIQNYLLLLNALVRSDKEKYNNDFVNFQNKIGKIDITNTSKDEIEKILKNSFIFLDIDNKENIDLSNRISVLKYIREELEDSTFVKNIILEDKFNVVTGISEKELILFIKNPSNPSEKIRNIFERDDLKDFQSEILDKINEAKKYYLNYKDEIPEEVKNKYSDEQIETLIINSFVLNFSKEKILEKFLENNSDYFRGYTGNDEELKIFAGIEGIGLLDFSDKTKFNTYEGFKLIAGELVALLAGAFTGGTGTVAVNSLLFGGRLLKLEKVAEGANIISKFGRGVKNTLKTTGVFGIETLSFYGGYGLAKSVLEGKNMYSWEGLGETMIFNGAFKGLQKVFKIAKINLDPNIPLKNQKIKLASQLVLEGTTLSGLGVGLEGLSYNENSGISFQPGEWTAEQILQGIAMAIAFRAMGKVGKLEIGKNGNKIELFSKSPKIKRTIVAKAEYDGKTIYKDDRGFLYTKNNGKYEIYKDKGFGVGHEIDLKNIKFENLDKSKNISLTKKDIEAQFAKMNEKEINLLKKNLDKEIKTLEYSIDFTKKHIEFKENVVKKEKEILEEIKANKITKEELDKYIKGTLKVEENNLTNKIEELEKKVNKLVDDSKKQRIEKQIENLNEELNELKNKIQEYEDIYMKKRNLTEKEIDAKIEQLETELSNIETQKTKLETEKTKLEAKKLEKEIVEKNLLYLEFEKELLENAKKLDGKTFEIDGEKYKIELSKKGNINFKKEDGSKLSNSEKEKLYKKLNDEGIVIAKKMRESFMNLFQKEQNKSLKDFFTKEQIENIKKKDSGKTWDLIQTLKVKDFWNYLKDGTKNRLKEVTDIFNPKWTIEGGFLNTLKNIVFGNKESVGKQNWLFGEKGARTYINNTIVLAAIETVIEDSMDNKEQTGREIARDFLMNMVGIRVFGLWRQDIYSTILKTDIWKNYVNDTNSDGIIKNGVQMINLGYETPKAIK